MQVANRYSAPAYNLTQLQQQQVAATVAVYDAAKLYYAAQALTDLIRQRVAETTIALGNATQVSNNIEKRLNDTTELRRTAECNLRQAEQLKNNASRILALATTVEANAEGVLLGAQGRANASAENAARASAGL